MSEQIIIKIDQNGNVSVQTQGFRGKACMNASQFIEEALGKIASLKKTGEYYTEEIPERVKVTSGGK